MRVVAILLAIGFVLGSADLAWAENGFDATKNFNQDGVTYGGDQSSGGPGADTRGSRGGSGGGGPPVYRASAPVVRVGPDGTSCLDSQSRTFPTQEAAAAFDAAQEIRWRTLAANYPLCPDAQVPQVSPATWALQFWGEVLLPKPAPRIAPGFAITGKTAYLETGGTMTGTYTRDTPLGPLTLQTIGRFFIDWGDGSPLAGPFEDVGGPWPTGRLTHVYTDVGAIDVVVTERWTATWRLGGEGGALLGLRTEGRIDDFPVQELQAVRNR
jgi:hypothetical protein